MTVRSLVALERAMAKLAVIKDDVENAKNEFYEAEEAMLGTPWGQTLTNARVRRDLLQADMKKAETEAREMILAAYAETGNKKPVPGAGIRVTRSVAYDLDAALGWCKENAPAFLTLDRKAFEKAVLAGLPGAPADVDESPTATIAKDLSAYVDSLEEVTP